MLHSYGIEVSRTVEAISCKLGILSLLFEQATWENFHPIEIMWTFFLKNLSIQKGPKTHPNFNWYIFIAKCWIGDGAFNLSNCIQFVLWFLLIYFSGIKLDLLELVYMHGWIIKLHCNWTFGTTVILRFIGR